MAGLISRISRKDKDNDQDYGQLAEDLSKDVFSLIDYVGELNKKMGGHKSRLPKNRIKSDQEMYGVHGGEPLASNEEIKKPAGDELG